MTKKRSRASWRAEVSSWLASGLSCEDYAESVSINPRSLAWWKWKLGSEGEVFEIEFVEVPETELAVEAEAAAGPGIDIVVGETRIHVPDGFESSTLSRVLDVVGDYT